MFGADVMMGRLLKLDVSKKKKTNSFWQTEGLYVL
jgi:hypothetical protein